ncbi:MAG: sigma-70 family RNA polymerase sigma factor [Planctomycetota bacterium]
MDLVHAYLEGSAAGEAAMIDRLRVLARILHALNRRLGFPLDTHDVEDLTGETTLLVLEKLREYEGRGAFDGWLSRICRYQLLNFMRKKLRRPQATDDLDALPNRAAGSDAEAELVAQENADRALERLGGSEAEVLRLRCFEGLDFDAIAERLGLSYVNAKARYYRGLRKLERLTPGLLDESQRPKEEQEERDERI